MLVEFSTSIPRAHLRPGYGDGFLGAPLQTGRPGCIPIVGEQGGRCGPSRTTSRTMLEVRVMFEPSRLSPACVAQAYEEVVPITRRTASQASHTERAGRESTMQRGGRRTAS
jgi:hypothetical protein